MRIVVISKATEEYLPFLVFFRNKYPKSEFWLLGDNPLRGLDAQLFSRVDEIRLNESRRSGLVLSFFFGEILPDTLLSQFNQAVNFHMSLLPNYPGAHALNWQLINGENRSGVTLHHMTNRVDGGPILRQMEFAVSREWDANDLLREGIRQSIRLAGDVEFEDLDGGVPQDSDEINNLFICKRRKPKDGEILPGFSASHIYNMSRALVEPWPGIFFTVAGHTINCRRALTLPECYFLKRVLDD